MARSAKVAASGTTDSRFCSRKVLAISADIRNSSAVVRPLDRMEPVDPELKELAESADYQLEATYQKNKKLFAEGRDCFNEQVHDGLRSA